MVDEHHERLSAASAVTANVYRDRGGCDGPLLIDLDLRLMHDLADGKVHLAVHSRQIGGSRYERVRHTESDQDGVKSQVRRERKFGEEELHLRGSAQRRE